jgi:adenosylcobinamide-GDP ribazoletransferase
MDRDRRLEVMADPAAGAFGVAAAVSVTVLRVAALAEGRPSVWLVAGVWCASRTVMAVGLRSLPYARPRGIARPFRGLARNLSVYPVGVLGLGAASGLAAASGLVPGVAAVAAVCAGGGAVLWLARRRLGGYTGDVLGAAGVIGETAGLVVAAARW